jgi:UDP-N-acetylmuramyl pentapeptide phosphotransferase/UDP-N-acetylglucosamine-1-phosphate transferase
LRILALTGVVLAWTGLTFAYAQAVTRRARTLSARNYRGIRLPLTLGLALLLLGFWVQGFRAHWFIDSTVRNSVPGRLTIALSLLLVFLVGWFDDYRSPSARGVGGHLKELAQGRVTTGVVKLVGIVAAATLVSITLSDQLVRVLLGIPVIAGSANLWNLLDVRPGRALKFFLVAALALIGWYARYDDLLLAGALGSAAALLVLDVRERAMLGDAGSNLLGFVIGVALFRVLPTWGLGVALAVILILHALGETVTLSRIIESTPPLRWFDRLGRLPANQTEPGPRDPTAA